MRQIVFLLLCLLVSGKAWADVAATLQGRVIDSQTGEGLVGATLQITPGNKMSVSDTDGAFTFQGLSPRTYTLTATYLGYQKVTLTINPARLDTVLVVRMEEMENLLGAATVTAHVKRNTENAIVTVQKNSLVVQSGISAQQISQSQDKDASEAIRRVPGISIIDQKFVMVRGLSQRYNNVWINGAAVPSSEADSRAFSFDIIPSSQMDNMQIVKSPAPQYPADFTGGFILIDTKDVPHSNTASVSVGASINDQTHFQSFHAGKGGKTDFLGFDNFRSLKNGLHTTLKPTPGGRGISLLGNGLNNDWRVRNQHPWADLSLAADFSRSREWDNGAVFAVLGAVNYHNGFKTYEPMENSLYGAYDLTHDQSVYLRRSTDHQYAQNVRLGAMLNFTFVPAGKSGRYEWKNIFNQLGTDRYTSREGFNAQSNQIKEAEYYYSSRTTYNTQLTGKYVWDHSRLDWNAGYAYANRNLPDRRRYTLDNQLDPDRIGLTTGNEISREFTRLDEHIGSAGVNYRYTFEGGKVEPELFTGGYAEYRSRQYGTRSFIYQWNTADNQLPADFRYLDLPTQLLVDANYGDNGLYLIDDTKMRNDYEGRYRVLSAYAAVNVPLGAFNLYAGGRFEHSRMELISNTRDYEVSPKSRFYEGNDFFPSVNATYRITPQHQVRASYGRSINRPEFREVSPSVFFDFDLASSVQGNTDLKACHIDNVDLRYEWYPAPGDQISLAAFYKHFDSPIEWTYTVTGGTDLVYSYENAHRAHNYGLELDVRKNLRFIGLPDFTLVFNGALIKSEVKFDKQSRQKDRPMQGQSPYLINLGVFYSHKDWNASLLYNRIGKRLIGVGRSLGSTGDQTVNIPDSYEMPRNSLDFSVARNFGKLNVKLGLKDIIGEKVLFKQFNEVSLPNGTQKEVEEVTRSYRPGRNFSLTLSYRF